MLRSTIFLQARFGILSPRLLSPNNLLRCCGLDDLLDWPQINNSQDRCQFHGSILRVWASREDKVVVELVQPHVKCSVLLFTMQYKLCFIQKKETNWTNKYIICSRDHLPTLSYITAADVWTITCFFHVLYTIIVHIIVNVLLNVSQKQPNLDPDNEKVTLENPDKLQKVFKFKT